MRWAAIGWSAVKGVVETLNAVFQPYDWISAVFPFLISSAFPPRVVFVPFFFWMPPPGNGLVDEVFSVCQVNSHHSRICMRYQAVSLVFKHFLFKPLPSFFRQFLVRVRVNGPPAPVSRRLDIEGGDVRDVVEAHLLRSCAEVLGSCHNLLPPCS